jgi:alpha-1,2-mannosyltransferase
MKRSTVILGAIAIDVALAIALLPWGDHSRIETTDFVNFYAAATIVREGRGAGLYQAAIETPIVQSILRRKVTDYFVHPPFEAAALVPLSYLSVEHAFVVWTLFNLTLLSLLPLVFGEFTQLVSRKPYTGLLGLVFPPALIALTLGQDSIVVLFTISVAFLLYSKKKPFTSGVTMALASVKFQYVLILALLFLLARKFRLVGGLLLGCTLLVLVSVLITGPTGLIGYLKFLRDFDLNGGYGSIHPELMVNLRGFLAGTRWVNNVRLYSSLGSVLFILLAIICTRWMHGVKADALCFSLFVAVALVTSPHTHFADATILFLPLLVSLDWVLSKPVTGFVDKLIIALCVLMFLEPVALICIGGHYWWNSRIYWMFPVICLFIVGSAVELYLNKIAIQQVV